MARVRTQVEELADNRVRLQVEVPVDHVKHAVEHASSDLAASTKIPGFRKGKVPQKVLEARIGRDRIFTEAVESHISGWFWNAAEDASVRPVSQPELNYDLPSSEDEPFSFTAEFAVQAPPEVAEWAGLEVPAVLQSGDHARIARWQRDQALRRTAERRPELLASLWPDLSPSDLAALRDAGFDSPPGAVAP